MIRNKLFRKHYVVSVTIVFAFLVFGFFISDYVMKATMRRAMSSNLMSGPSELFARLIDDMNPKDRVAGLNRFQKIAGDQLPSRFLIVDGNGKNLGNDLPLPFSWGKITKPVDPFQFKPLGESYDFRPEPGMPSFDRILRFPGDPAQYLVELQSSRFSKFAGKPTFGPPGSPPVGVFLLMVGSQVFSVLIGVGFALFLLFRSMREKMGLVDSVIGELQAGNLKARFPIRPLDEMGQAMSRFNKMADEIEILVERLRSVEKSRMVLLQDLTHDLRTPIASLKNLLVTIEKRKDSADLSTRSELIALAQREVDYFERLVEDLLMLAQVSEPQYRPNQDLVSILDIVTDESDSVATRVESDGKSVKITCLDDNNGQKMVSGDVHLLRRLFRNALENSCFFAESKVVVFLDTSISSQVRILVTDDGPGFSEFSLKNYGERRASRVVARSQGNRVSVGLGSVIMKTIAGLHRGRISICNRKDVAGRILGAEVEIILPIS